MADKRVYFNDEWNQEKARKRPNAAHYDSMKDYYEDLEKYEQWLTENEEKNIT